MTNRNTATEPLHRGSTSLWPFPVIRERTGTSHAEWYRQMARALAPRPVKIGSASRWPSHEIESLILARIAGKSDDEIRQLVSAMHATRVALRAA